MTVLGEGHFGTRLETLAGEEVLWEGGPSRHATLIHTARFALAVCSLSLVFGLILTLTLLLPRPVRPPQADAPRAIAMRAPIAPVWPLGTLGVVGCGVASLVVASLRARRRNAWYVVTSERVCIQTGAFTRVLSVIDLDKVVSVRVSCSWLERRLGLQTIDLHYAGQIQRPPYQADPHTLAFIGQELPLVSALVNRWLPRDNKRASTT